MPRKVPAPIAVIEHRIYVLRDTKVMLSSDLAALYQVEVRALVQAVKRNTDRFPEDFMFQLTPEEFSNLKSQIVISSWGGSRRAEPYAFTELGVAMLSSVLKSAHAVQMNIRIMRTFVRLREQLSTHKDLARKLEDLNATQKQHTSIITVVVEEINKLKQSSPSPRKRRIGYITDQK